MPERPELDHIVPRLHEALVGQRVAAVRVLDPVVLRVAVEGDVREVLAGRCITGVSRHAHFVVFTLDGSPERELAVHPMLAGRFRLDPADQRLHKRTAFVLVLEDGRELRYRDDRQMGKVYVLDPARRASVPGLGPPGVDVLGPGFTRAVFRALARKRRDQVKLFLLDKSQLDSLGNAYADESLFAAGIHPKARVRDLSDDDLDRLRDAIVETLSHARAEVHRRQPALDEKVRDFLKVRNRKGEPCPVCQTPIRVAGVRGHDAFFCGVCQPDGKGRGFIDWRKAGRRGP